MDEHPKPLKPPDRIRPLQDIPAEVQKLKDSAKDVPIEDMDIRAVAAMVGDTTWNTENGNKVTPQFIADACQTHGYLRTMTMYPDPNLWHHIDRIQTSDLSMPILIYKGKIIDGHHLLVKAVIENQKTVKVKNIPETRSSAS